MKLLYIGQQSTHVNSGAAQINQRNREVLISIFKDEFTEIVPITNNGFLSKYKWGNNKTFIRELCLLIEKEKYNYIFLGQSLYGYIAKVIRKKFPMIKIITFFHNIEIQYAKEYTKKRGIFGCPFYLATKYVERLSIKYSDYFITLNERDALLLDKIYNKQASLILPTSFKDKFILSSTQYQQVKLYDIIYLFVGIAFFANVEGIRWFIKNVLPFVPGKLIIVGNGMDKYSNELSSDRVVIKGYVEDLSDYYNSATFVVSPIFSGGGMKTKTAEALMYGKTILATDEALEGYIIDEKAIHVCNNKQEFIKTIQELTLNPNINKFNSHSRRLFKEYYSFESSVSAFLQFFNELK